MERTFSGEFQSDCLNFPGHFSVGCCVQFDDDISSSCYLFFYLDTHPEGNSALPGTLFWELQLTAIKGLPQQISAGCFQQVT